MAKKNYQTHLTAVFTGTLLLLAPLAAISLQAVSVADGNEARLTDKVDWRAFLNRARSGLGDAADAV